MATKTASVLFNTNFDLNSFLARGGKLEAGTFAFDSSYPTGGEAMTFGFTPIVVIVPPFSGYTFQWTGSKLLAYYADYDAAADGVLIQVANAADLSALTAVPYLAIGF